MKTDVLALALKPCPFCGRNSARIECCDEESHPNFGSRWVECGNCHVSTPIIFAVADCVDDALADIWNRRHADD
jgi:hypothetical protein